jgi:phosphoglycolate phosphatase-like HAD superfamily hydrolase
VLFDIDGTLLHSHGAGRRAMEAALIGEFTLPPHRFGAITIPTLVIDGGTTPWMTHTADALAKAVPTAQRHTLTGQPHNVADDVMAPVVIDFVLAGAS